MTIAAMTHRCKNASRDPSRRSLVADVTEFRLENTFTYEQVAQWL